MVTSSSLGIEGVNLGNNFRGSFFFESKARTLIKMRVCKADVMYFWNVHMALFADDMVEVLDEYHQRSNHEGWNGHAKRHYELETGLHIVGLRAITRHVLWMLVTMHIVAIVRLQ